MKMAYVLGKWSDTGTQRRMLGHSLRGEMTEPFVETRHYRRSSLDRNRSVEGMASMATTTGLGCILVNAENAGLASVWSVNLFRSLMCAAAVNDDVEVLEQLFRIAGHFEVNLQPCKANIAIRLLLYKMLEYNVMERVLPLKSLLDV